MSRTLLLPCAGRSSRYPGVRPKWMLTLPNGELALQRAVGSVAQDSWERMVVAVRADHDESYGCIELLRRAFGNDIMVVVISGDTRGPADTVAHMIREAQVSGAFMVKDADSFFDPSDLPSGNFVSLSDVRQTPDMTNIGAKSFAVLNGDGLIVEMVEKTLASNFVCIGLYGLADVQTYLEHFNAIAGERAAGEIFISHVMNRAIANGLSVVPHAARGLIDVGTLEDWRRYVRSRGTIVCDLDGVVFRNHSSYFPPYWEEPDEPIEANVAILREWQAAGAQLVFMTSRPERYRAKTAVALIALGLQTHALVMDCQHGRRFLINDHASSNPYPSAVGISLERDRPSLADYLKDWR
jgi:hypothetical protein